MGDLRRVLFAVPDEVVGEPSSKASASSGRRLTAEQSAEVELRVESVPRALREPAALAVARQLEGELERVARDYDGSHSLLILGPTGVGKSLAVAYAALRMGIEHVRGTSRPRVDWRRADELTRAASERGGTVAIDAASKAPLLVVDDLGWERWQEAVLEVIGSRYDRGRPTVVTSGLTFDGFATRYGDATARRLEAHGRGRIIDLWGAS